MPQRIDAGDSRFSVMGLLHELRRIERLPPHQQEAELARIMGEQLSAVIAFLERLPSTIASASAAHDDALDQQLCDLLVTLMQRADLAPLSRESLALWVEHQLQPDVALSPEAQAKLDVVARKLAGRIFSARGLLKRQGAKIQRVITIYVIEGAQAREHRAEELLSFDEVQHGLRERLLRDSEVALPFFDHPAR